MDQLLSFLIIGMGIFVWFALVKLKQKPYIVNFSLSAMLLLIVWKTSLMDPLDWLSIGVIVMCGLAFIMQLVMGIRSIQLAKE
ncbi:hypothetical protein [Sporosarcina sp. G11-34]|uniref:hypothetical protein n=1 Tax=Sporosarcina sp. G11-34 TaxID=2849605 RepID=UPI0022A8F9FE|nr:hypothetical protein [Sporosarcina sp. G11-34]MCZ2257705.1 hypothetical protein [Sporosarcina sp. G11-34]